MFVSCCGFGCDAVSSSLVPGDKDKNVTGRWRDDLSEWGGDSLFTDHGRRCTRFCSSDNPHADWRTQGQRRGSGGGEGGREGCVWTGDTTRWVFDNSVGAVEKESTRCCDKSSFSCISDCTAPPSPLCLPPPPFCDNPWLLAAKEIMSARRAVVGPSPIMALSRHAEPSPSRVVSGL